MEVVIAAFIGIWLSGAGVLAYRQLKKDFNGERGDKKRGDAR